MRFLDELRRRLGPEYDVEWETFRNPARNQIHIEYDPVKGASPR